MHEMYMLDKPGLQIHARRFIIYYFSPIIHITLEAEKKLYLSLIWRDGNITLSLNK